MGNTFQYFINVAYQFMQIFWNNEINLSGQDSIVYSVFDQEQIIEPVGTTKNIVNIQNKNYPKRLSSVVHKGCNTVWRSFKRSVWRHPERNFLGCRIKTIENLTAHRNMPQEADYVWKTWQQVDDEVEALSNIIIRKKLCPKIKFQQNGTPDMKLTAIFSENRLEYFMTQLACCSDSIAFISIPIMYQNEQEIGQLIEFSEIKTIFVSNQTIRAIIELKKNGALNNLKNIILFDQLDGTFTSIAQQLSLNIIYFYDMVNEGFFCQEATKEEPVPDTVYLLAVTPATTGQSKIVMLSHMNLMCGQAGYKFLGFDFVQTDVYLSYVPFSHVQEQLIHVSATVHGFKIGYSSGDIQNLIEDIKILKPTFFGSFPGFFRKIYSKILDRIDKTPQILKTIINHAIQQKILSFSKKGELRSLIYDALVFQQMRQLLGGNIRFFISGGGSLDVQIKMFLSVVFSAPIVEAYGSFETGGFISATSVYDIEGGHVGGVLPCNIMQLRSVDSLNVVTNQSSLQGEIYLKGNSIFVGYFKNQELTKSVKDDEGWFKTGDFGILSMNGSITVLDRIKDIQENKNGNLVSPQKLESIYSNVILIDRIMVDANKNFNFLVAIIHLNEEAILQFGQDNELGNDLHYLMKCKEVEFEILKRFSKIAHQSKLKPYEKILQVHILDKDFTFQSGLLSNTQKLKRKEIKKIYQTQLDKMYFEASSQQQRYSN